jgi:protein involved in polysaccharide export with SLBB domain
MTIHKTMAAASRMRLPRTLALLFSLLTLAVPARAQGGDATRTPGTLTLQPGDGLKIRIFQEPELSGEFMVNERGNVVLPKLGEVAVSSISADSLRPVLRAAYRRYLTTDAIEITPFRRIAVSGAVLKPGLYPIDPAMSVGDAIILAGGVAPFGKPNVVEVRLATAKQGVPISSEQRLWESNVGGGRQLHVPTQSWLSRNLATVASVTVSLISATALLINVIR